MGPGERNLTSGPRVAFPCNRGRETLGRSSPESGRGGLHFSGDVKGASGVRNDKPWQVFVMVRGDMDRVDGDRLLSKAGYNSRVSSHPTEREAKEKAEEMLRRLKGVDEDTEWVACYVEPFTDTNWSENRAQKLVRFEDLPDD